MAKEYFQRGQREPDTVARLHHISLRLHQLRLGIEQLEHRSRPGAIAGILHPVDFVGNGRPR